MVLYMSIAVGNGRKNARGACLKSLDATCDSGITFGDGANTRDVSVLYFLVGLASVVSLGDEFQVGKHGDNIGFCFVVFAVSSSCVSFLLIWSKRL